MPKQKRGEVWLVDLGMVAKVRPCLVISTRAFVQDRARYRCDPYNEHTRLKV